MTATLAKSDALRGRAVAAEGAIAAACAGAGAAIAARGGERIERLVVDAGALFGGGGRAGLRAALDGARSTVHEVAMSRSLGDRASAGGRIVLVAPRADAGEHAGAAGATLENLARTPAVEWARFGVRATVVVPGSRNADDELAAPVAFVASAAGAYFSGCRFTLR